MWSAFRVTLSLRRGYLLLRDTSTHTPGLFLGITDTLTHIGMPIGAERSLRAAIMTPYEVENLPEEFGTIREMACDR